MIAKVHSAAYLGIKAYPVEIEVDVTNGLPQFTVVGLPDTSVRESRDRVRSAIKNSGFPFPKERITVNLAPADIKKEGASFDLPVAIGILAASDLIPLQKLQEFIFLGELALDGSLRPFQGAIVIASSLHHKSFVFPYENAKEASLEKNSTVYPIRHLSEAIEFLRSEKTIRPIQNGTAKFQSLASHASMDFSEVRGQSFAKRAIEIAVAGGHNLLLIGPPGSGKTMLASRIPSILPPLDFNEALEITKIHSVAGHRGNDYALIRERPFRAPHHSISPVAMIGGGSWPKPGEISLAHAGVLFLDEFPEFRRDVLEALRSPLEEGEITVSRVKSQITFPSRILLAAAMNPCPCGYLTDRQKSCRCSLSQIHKYQSKVSGPILDRIDLHIEVSTLPIQTLTNDFISENSSTIQTRILNARQIQSRRYPKRYPKLNATMRPRDIKNDARPTDEGKKLLETAIQKLRLSARGYFKILKVTRTIADLANEPMILPQHIAEAIQYRSLDRQWWI